MNENNKMQVAFEYLLMVLFSSASLMIISESDSGTFSFVTGAIFVVTSSVIGVFAGRKIDKKIYALYGEKGLNRAGISVGALLTWMIIGLWFY